MTEADLLNHLQSNPFLLAPMAGITHCAFRLTMRELGCGIVISELVSANGLKHASEKTKALMRFSEAERPVGIQIFGEDGEALASAAQYVEELGADFVDLNLGCPVRKVVTKGAGSALLRDPLALGRILQQIRSAINIPLTIKIRTGWDHTQKNADEVVEVAHDSGVTWVAIHGRTRSQAYNGVADWDYIAEVKAKSRLPIIGNGDITSPALAVRRLKESGCDGVMIGRGCLKNPWIFRQANALWAQGKEIQPERNFLALFKRLQEESEKVHDEKFMMLQMRKFAAWYSSGYPGSAQFRKDIFATRDLEQTLGAIQRFYGRLSSLRQIDTSHEKFLMGGHG